MSKMQMMFGQNEPVSDMVLFIGFDFYSDDIRSSATRLPVTITSAVLLRHGRLGVGKL